MQFFQGHSIISRLIIIIIIIRNSSKTWVSCFPSYLKASKASRHCCLSYACRSACVPFKNSGAHFNSSAQYPFCICFSKKREEFLICRIMKMWSEPRKYLKTRQEASFSLFPQESIKHNLITPCCECVLARESSRWWEIRAFGLASFICSTHYSLPMNMKLHWTWGV